MLLNKHGSFYIRNGWPTKIIDSLVVDEHIFSPNNELNAVDSIGVGRVMIKAMRYWACVLGIADEGKDQQGITHRLTDLARLVLENDPYCTDIGTLWLFHRNLVRNVENATAWNWAFNTYDEPSFLKDDFVNAFYAYIQREGVSYAKKAVEKEFDCFKNTYVSDQALSINKIVEEDTVPFFAPLKLIEYKGQGRFERRKVQAKEIPADIFFACLLLDNTEHLETNKQISIDYILEGYNQAGKYMNLSYSALLELLQKLENSHYLRLINNFGNRYIETNETDAIGIMESHYHMIGR
ncbi:MAG: DUF4007 family protein [Candidatus Fimisoma sp.]|nr:DUF4007 family protein [Candidatus Fimisoma sp.]